MPADIPLTPEAAAVVAAFDAAMGIDDSTGLFEDSRNALVAALRELAACVLIDMEILAIADNIEQAITYAETPADGN